MRAIFGMVRASMLLVSIAALCIVRPAAAESPHYHCFSGSDWDGDGSGDLALWRFADGRWFVSGVTRFHYGGGSAGAAGQFDEPVLRISPFTYKATAGVYRLGGWYLKDFAAPIYFGGIWDDPVPANYDNYTADNIAIFRDGLWAVIYQNRYCIGKAGDIPVPGHWVNYNIIDPAIYRPETDRWSIWHNDKVYNAFFLGEPGDIPVPGNYVGYTWQPAVFRPSTGMWVIQDVTRFYFGTNGDWPIVANMGRTSFEENWWNDDPVIYRPGQGLFRIKGAFFGGGNTRWMGGSGDIPVAGPHR